MDDGIGRAADRGVDADGVLEVLAGQDLRHDEVLADHVDDAPAGELRQHHAAGVDGRNRGVAGHAHAEALDHRRHGRGGAHGHAMAGRAAHARLGVEEIGERHLAGLDVLAEAPDVGAGADLLAAKLAVQHRAAGDGDGRQVAARRAHEEGRRGLVAADEEDDAVDRVAADRFLDVHADEIAEEHGGRAEVRIRRATSPEIRAAGRRPRARRVFTRSAIWRKWALQGVSSDQVLQMPMTGRPSKELGGMPSFFIQLRCIMESRLLPPNQACERSFRPLVLICLGVPSSNVFCRRIFSAFERVLFRIVDELVHCCAAPPRDRAPAMAS